MTILYTLEKIISGHNSKVYQKPQEKVVQYKSIDTPK